MVVEKENGIGRGEQGKESLKDGEVQKDKRVTEYGEFKDYEDYEVPKILKNPRKVSMSRLAIFTFTVLFLAANIALMLIFADADGEKEVAVMDNVKKEVDFVLNFVDGEETEKVKNDISKILQRLRDGNGFLEVAIGESEKEFYIFNKKGEAILESPVNGVTTVHTKDNKSIMFVGDRESKDTSLKVTKDEDTTILSIMEQAIKLVGTSDNVKLYRIDGGNGEKVDKESDSGVKYDGYKVIITGKKGVKELFGYMSEKYRNSMVSNFTNVVGEDTVDENKMSIIITYLYGEDKEFSSSMVYRGDSDKEYMLWYTDGYLLLDDWELDEKWYSELSDREYIDELDKLLKDFKDVYGDE